MRKTISPSLGSKSTSGFGEFSQYLIASCSAQQLLENPSMDSTFSPGLHGTTERKTKQTEVSPELQMRSNRHAKFYDVLKANYCIKTSPHFSMDYN